METLELVIFLLAAIAVSGIADRFLRNVSLPLVQIATGVIIALIVNLPLEQGLDLELLLVLFIAPLHFNESRHVSTGALFSNRWGIISLSLGLVAAIVVVMGFALDRLVPAVPISLALAFGAAMGSTDAVAVTNLSKDYSFTRRHRSLLEGEALFNDVTGTVVFKSTVALAVTGALSFAEVTEEFLLESVGALFGGALMGFAAWLVLYLIRRLGVTDPTLHVIIEIVLPFGIYFIAHSIHIGAVIAVVVAGMVMEILPHRHTAQTSRQKIQSRGVWETVTYLLNGIIFVILGMQLPRLFAPVLEGGFADVAMMVGIVLLLTLLLEGVRFLWLWGLDRVHSRSRKTDFKELLAMTFAGSKGGVTLALMLTLPSALPMGDGAAIRETLISIASGVILCTLLCANYLVPLFVKRKKDAKMTASRTDMEIRLIERVIASIEADAAFTGSVTEEHFVQKVLEDLPDSSLAESVIGAEVDEPATMIVMNQYADYLEDLLPHASAEVVKDVKAIIAYCDKLYSTLDEDEEALAANKADIEKKHRISPRKRMSKRLEKIRELSSAIDSVRYQALIRELELIEDMRKKGQLDDELARELRENAMVQQLAM